MRSPGESQSDSRPKVLVTRRQFQDQVDRLNKVAHTVVLDRPAPATPLELQAAAQGCTGIFAHITDAVDGKLPPNCVNADRIDWGQADAS